jgi:hypothetical protein
LSRPLSFAAECFAPAAPALAQPCAFSRRESARGIVRLRAAHSKIEGARDAGDCRSPRPRVRKVKAHERSLPRAPEANPASRTRCWWLAPRGPRWTDRTPLSERPMLYPPLAEPLTGATVFGIREAPDPEVPCDARQARRAPRGLGRFRPGALRPFLKPPPPAPRQSTL